MPQPADALSGFFVFCAPRWKVGDEPGLPHDRMQRAPKEEVDR
jgi:hypothetical protein